MVAGASARDRNRLSDAAVPAVEPPGASGLPTSPVLRLIAAVRYARRLFTLGGLQYGALLAVITVLGGGAAFAASEGSDVSTWDGVWVGGDDDDHRRLRGHYARHERRPLHCDSRHGGRHRLPHAPDWIRVGEVPRGRPAREGRGGGVGSGRGRRCR